MHHVFNNTPDNKYSIALLIKESAFDKHSLLKHYVLPSSLSDNNFICFGLKYFPTGKCPVKFIKEYLVDLLSDIKTVGATTLLVADPNYFKVLTGERKSEPHHGYIKPCNIKGYEYLNIILSINYQALFHNPTIQDKLSLSLVTLKNHISGTHVDIGVNVIHSASYPNNKTDIKNWLDKLHQYSELVIDIETFSLQFWKAGIGTISFAWNEHSGIAFCCDYEENSYPEYSPYFGHQTNNKEIKSLLLNFFLTYKGKCIYHNATFDIKILIYELFMKDSLDYEGLLHGLEVMNRSIDDTKLISYLATNTTAGNNLSLKSLAFEHGGNYAQDDIEDIRKISKEDLLRYNLVDSLCTWYVKNKYMPILIQDEQLNLYLNLFITGTKTIIHTELTGMPINMPEVLKLENKLKNDISLYEKNLRDSPVIKAFEWQMQRIAMIDANLLLKKKIRPIEEFYLPFNPASGNQVAHLLHQHLSFEILEKTPTGMPAVGAKVLKKHLNKLIQDFDLKDEDFK